jgi:hypothetical protein
MISNVTGSIENVTGSIDRAVTPFQERLKASAAEWLHVRRQPQDRQGARHHLPRNAEGHCGKVIE